MNIEIKNTIIDNKRIEYSSTQLDIMYAAEEVMGKKGIENTTHREIIEHSNQKNISAINYHFKGLEGLIDGILNIRMDVLMSERRELLKKKEKDNIINNFDLVEAYILPLYNRTFYDDRWRYYIFFINDLLLNYKYQTIVNLLKYNFPSSIIERNIAKINNYPNDLIFKERIMSNGRFYISSLAARKREIDSGNTDILTEKDYLDFLLKTSLGIISGQP
jgi:AcrR family transcriptional regulator